MDGYYVVGIIVIPYTRFEMIINIVSKEDIACCITIDDIPHWTWFVFTKMSSQSLGEKGKWMHCKHLYYMLRFMCKVDYNKDKFIHTPTLHFQCGNAST